MHQQFNYVLVFLCYGSFTVDIFVCLVNLQLPVSGISKEVKKKWRCFKGNTNATAAAGIKLVSQTEGRPEFDELSST